MTIKGNNPYIKLARENLTKYIENRHILNILPDYITKEMQQTRRGVFVTLHKNGNLRGCIGTISPVTESIVGEIIRNSIEAGVYDPRFPAVTKDELKDIQFSVDVLSKPERTSRENLDPKKYGIIITSNGKSGVLLPDLEGVDTVDEQIDITLKKAQINKCENYEIERFTVTRYEEE